MRGFLLGLLVAVVMAAALLGMGWALSGPYPAYDTKKAGAPCEYDSMQWCAPGEKAAP